MLLNTNEIRPIEKGVWSGYRADGNSKGPFSHSRVLRRISSSRGTDRREGKASPVVFSSDQTT